MSDEREGWKTIEMREKWERMKHKRDRRGIVMEKTKERWKKSRLGGSRREVEEQ